MSTFEEEATELSDEADLLPVGTELLRGSYRITRYIASGGFGKTYMAVDSLDRVVVIKECFPADFCCRSGRNVVAMSRAGDDEFRSLVELFKTEARNLCKLNHPNIVKVHQAFDENNTAYMVLDHIDGRDLGTAIADRQSPLTPDVITKIANKLVNALATIHAAGVLHRDISPDNVLLTKDGEPVLIDFGAARQLVIKTSRKLSSLRTVKDGYSPQEFYAADEELDFSSDLYALAATLHFAITGYPPPIAQERVASVASGQVDPYRPVAQHVAGYDTNLLKAIDRALALFQIDRPQSAKEWRQLAQGFRIPNRAQQWRRVSSVRAFRQISRVHNSELIASARATDPLRNLRGLSAEAAPRNIAKGLLAISAALAALTLGGGTFLVAHGTETATSTIETRIETAATLEADFLFMDGTGLDLIEESGATFLRVGFRPSASAFEVGDVILGLMPDGAAVGTPEALRRARDRARAAGATELRFAVRRGDAVHLIDVTLASLDERPEG